MQKESHNKTVVEQFSKQAQSYTAIVAHSDALETLVEITQASSKDTVLDVACGTGIVACEFARHVKHVTGIDITEVMITEAKKLQAKRFLTNIDWHVGEVNTLPFADNQFSIVLSRFGFHHFLNPEKVLHEMIRVSKPDGFVMVVDVSVPADKIDAYNIMEKLRDPSHAAALSNEQFDALMSNSGLKDLRKNKYTMSIELEEQLNASFPDNNGHEKLKQMIINDLGIDMLGINAQRLNDEVRIEYPIYIYAGNKKVS